MEGWGGDTDHIQAWHAYTDQCTVPKRVRDKDRLPDMSGEINTHCMAVTFYSAIWQQGMVRWGNIVL